MLSAGPPSPASLAEISRNTSVISSSSSSSSSSSLIDHDRTQKLPLPVPIRPTRTFAAPRSASDVAQSQSQLNQLPSYIQRELGITGAPTAASAPPTSPLRDPAIHPGPIPRPRFNSPQDFEFGEILGHGSYSTVIQAKGKKSGKAYAIKVLDKAHLQRHNQRRTAYAEKEALVALGLTHPGIVGLHSTFSDAWSLYFVLDLLPNGDLRALISRYGSLSLQCTRYYIAQLTDALAYIHSKGVMHRDIKPENLLLDSHFRLALADYGTAKVLPPLTTVHPVNSRPDNADTLAALTSQPHIALRRSNTFVGTPQYYSPELLAHSHTSAASDLWALGCVVFELHTGTFAFQGPSPLLTWRLIKALQYTIPEGFDDDARDLVARLLVEDPEKRLGAGGQSKENGMLELKTHPFFNTVNWEKIWDVPHPTLGSGLKEPTEPVTIPESDAELGAQLREERLLDHDDDEIAWAKDAKIAAYLPGLRHANSANAGVSGNGDVAHLSESSSDGEEGGDPSVTATGGFGRYVFPRVEQEGKEMQEGAISYDAPSLREDVSQKDGDLVGAVAGLALDVPVSVDVVQAKKSNGIANDHSTVVPAQPSSSIPILRIDTHSPPPPEFTQLLQPKEQLLLWSPLVPEAFVPSFSRILPKLLSGSLRSKPKLRERVLLLTNKRVLCVGAGKSMGTVKQEFTFPLAGSGDNGGSVGVIRGVEQRGEKGVAFFTGDKPIVYTLDETAALDRWVQLVHGLLKTREPVTGSGE